MEENMLNAAVRELAGITEELEGLRKIRDGITKELADARSVLAECSGMLAEFREISRSIGEAGSVLRDYTERMEALNTELGGTVAEARQLENRIMMEKMELLLSRAESIAQSTEKASERLENEHDREDTR